MSNPYLSELELSSSDPVSISPAHTIYLKPNSDSPLLELALG